MMVFPFIVVANSMEPPGIVVIIEGNDDNVDAWLEFEGTTLEGDEREWPFEVQYWFDSHKGDIPNRNLVLHVQTSEKHLEFPITENNKYHNTYTVKMNSEEMIEGKSLTRSMVLVTSRVMLTLLLEGIVFYLLGFRKRQSWIMFLIINLITQSALNIYINSMEVAISYPIIILFVAEFWVFLVEMIAFPFLVKEKKKSYKVFYAVLSNVLSLILGGYLLTLLPI
jgi:hypothetical protein